MRLILLTLAFACSACGPPDGPVLFEFALAPTAELGWASTLPVTSFAPSDFSNATAHCIGTVAEQSLVVHVEGLPPVPTAQAGYWLMLLLGDHPIMPLGENHEDSEELVRKELGPLAPDSLGRTTRTFLEPDLAHAAGAVIELRMEGETSVDVLSGNIGNLEAAASISEKAPESTGHKH